MRSGNCDALVKLLKNERSNNCEACKKWDLLIQVRLEKIRPSAVANTEKHINMTNERPRGIKNGMTRWEEYMSISINSHFWCQTGDLTPNPRAMSLIG